MKIAVCVKEVLDTRISLQVVPQTGEVVQFGTDRLRLINPADRAAIEAAFEVKRQNPGTRVEVFSVCEAGQEGALYFARARGSDAVERLAPDAAHSAPPHTALLLATRLGEGKFDLLCCGDETLDNSSAMVGPLIAELLGLPQVTAVCRLRECRGGTLLVERSLDRGRRELVEFVLPGLATFKVEAAEFQYVSARRLELARKQEIPVRRLRLEPIAASLPKWPESEKRVPPRARVRRKFTPDADLPAAERVKMIMSGGLSSQQSGQNSSVLEGNSDYLSEQLFRFLKHHEFI